MLRRAFGPAGVPFPEPFDPEAALALARRFEVSARIAARQGREGLTAELGAGAAAGFGRDRTAAVAAGLRTEAVARRVAEAAAGLDIPLAFLKLLALEAAGVLAAGSRDACDVDVLAPEERMEDLWRALLAAGWRGSGLPEAEHQLPALQDPEGGVVEIHRLLPGVRLTGESSATFGDLERLGFLEVLTGWPGRSSVPAPEVQAAHVLVHGLGQHGYWPASYSLLKMVADLIDLNVLGKALTDRAAQWVAKDVPAAEAEAVRGLCASLEAGTEPQGDAEVLLRHILAGRLDPDYEQSLRLGLFRSQPSDRSRPVQLARAVLGAVFLTDAQIDALYGRPRTRLGYLGRRIARPFDLLLRLGRYGLQWVKVYTPRP